VNVGAVGAVGAGAESVARVSDTAAVPAITATAAPVATPPSAVAATPSAAPVAPFANPAIVRIAENVAFAALQAGTTVVPTAASSPASPSAVLSGDTGLLVQSYGAVALVEAPLALPPVYAQRALPAIPKVDPVMRSAGARPVRG